MSDAPTPGLLARACAWIAAAEGHALATGRPLTLAQMGDARLAGVAEPARVRVLVVPCIPQPDDPVTAGMARGLGLVTPATLGLSARYGLYFRSGCEGDRQVLVHELAHTAQYEWLGSIEAFLGQMLRAVEEVTWPHSALEQEAVGVADRVCGTCPP